MENFWDFSVWGWFNVLAVLLMSLLAAKALKKVVPILNASLIPTSVLGGGILLIVAGIYKLITGSVMFDEPFFGASGTTTLEIITYHALALGFIASTFNSSDGKISKKRAVEIFNTGVTTVATYLIQAVLGLGITLVASMVIIPACFAYGLDVGAGPALLFVTLPRILQDIPLGQVFAIILYTAMVFAGVSSLQNMFEAVGESLENRFPKLKRKTVLILSEEHTVFITDDIGKIARLTTE